MIYIGFKSQICHACNTASNKSPIYGERITVANLLQPLNHRFVAINGIVFKIFTAKFLFFIINNLPLCADPCQPCL